MASEYNLFQRITQLSDATDWHDAKTEWQLECVEDVRDSGAALGACLCGHQPIRYLCHMTNWQNANRCIVGNKCVEKFIGLDPALVLNGYGRIREKLDAPMNAALIDFAQQKGWVSPAQRNFLHATKRRKKKMPKPYSGNLLEVRRVLNQLVIDQWRRDVEAQRAVAKAETQGVVVPYQRQPEAVEAAD